MTESRWQAPKSQFAHCEATLEPADASQVARGWGQNWGPESDLLGIRGPSRHLRDPWDENRVKLAWSESAEFVGQPLIQQPD